MHPVEFRLPAEWERQSAMLLAWPGADSDWSDVLEEVRNEYVQLIETVLDHQSVVLLVPPGDTSAPTRLGERAGLEFLEVRYNDTWCRDYGPVVLCSAGQRLALDFHFDGWGGKHEARLDDRVNSLLARHPLFSEFEFRQSLFEIEGGAIECDGDGTLLVNRHCMRTRHPYLDDTEVDYELRAWFNVSHLLEIDMPPMPGDDTDGHIDTLARFAGRDRIVFQTQQHDSATRKLTGQLELLKSRHGRPYELVSLPVPDDLDPALAASYANFIVLNDTVLVPRFGSHADEAALSIVAEQFPDRTARAVKASTLITQGGGPHCASMQIPTALA